MKSVGGMLWDLLCYGMSGVWLIMCIILAASIGVNSTLSPLCEYYLFKGVLMTWTVSMAWIGLAVWPQLIDFGQEWDRRRRK